MPLDGEQAERFAQSIAALCINFGREADHPTLLAYEMALEDIPLDRINHAVRRAIRECRQMPSGAELRELSGELPLASRATIAWGALSRAVQTVGSYHSVDFDDPLINAATRNLGGWVQVCECPAEEFERFLRLRFERVYIQFCRNGCPAELARPLVGIHATNNSRIEGYVEPLHRIATGLKPLQSLRFHEDRRRIGAADVLKSIP